MHFISVHSLSHVWLFGTPIDSSMPGLPVLHQLPELSQTHVHPVSDAIQPSHPLSSPFPPAFNLSQHQAESQCNRKDVTDKETWNMKNCNKAFIYFWYFMNTRGWIGQFVMKLRKLFPWSKLRHLCLCLCLPTLLHCVEEVPSSVQFLAKWVVSKLTGLSR